jgi:glycosyltransferase involved in cell wall biosynthesis
MTAPLSFLICDRRIPALAGTRPTVATVLEEMGHRITMTEDTPRDYGGFDVMLQWGNPGYYPRIFRQLRSMPAEKRPLVAVMYAEPLPAPVASGLPRWPGLNAAEIAKMLLRDWRATAVYTNARRLRRLMRDGSIDLLFVIGGEQEEYAAEQKYQAWRYDYGYHRNFGTLLGLERDVDVLFLGETRQRRRRKLLKRLADDGIHVTVRGSWHKKDKALWGEERTRFLNRTKILVHLQRYPGKVASKRFVLAMANGALVISEPSYRPDPFIEGEHFISATAERMPEVIRYYLAHPGERERITTAAHRFVTEELTWEKTMDRVVAVIRRAIEDRSNRVL